MKADPFPRKRDFKKHPRQKRAAKKTTARLLRHIPPQLPTLREAPPEGPQWVHEIKFDGYRMAALLEDGRCRLITRNGFDWTDRYPGVANAAGMLDAESAILDGELVALDEMGRSRFGKLRDATPATSLACYFFDLLYLDGEDLRALPLFKRKQRLEALLEGAPAMLRYSSHITGSGAMVAEKACAMGLEGVVSKKASAPYASGRNESWIKSKCIKNDEFVIGGWRPSTTKARPFASLLLGEYENGVLHYRGRVGSGFDDGTLDAVSKQLASLRRAESPFDAVPRIEARDAKWVEPRLIAQVNYTERTESGVLRHPTFLGLRLDKAAREVVMEKHKVGPKKELFRGVRLTHPDREMYPETDVTKQDIAAHYAGCAGEFLRFSANRPVSLVRCPDGTGAKCFFQKHESQGAPKETVSTAIEEKDGGVERYLAIRDEKSVLAAVQMSAIEFHIWGSRTDRIENPDRIVFDLDPDEDLPFATVREAAFAVREALREIGIESFPMLTGGKGIHVIAPVARTRDWPEIKAFCRGLAILFARTAPTVFIAEASKARRRGKIFIDWMRNQRGATAIAPYSLRAREGAPVATPVSWKELKSFDNARAFTIRTIGMRLKRASDPWPGYDALKQGIRKAAFDRVTKI